MNTVKFKVKCTHCQHANLIAVAEAMLGKHSLRKCEACQQLFPFTVPSKEKVSQLVRGQQPAASPKIEEDEFRTTITSSNPGKAEKTLVLDCKMNENGRSQRFEVRQPYMTIGRLSSERDSYRADIALETADVYLSRKHAVVKKYANSFTISDAGSANGTYLNQNKLGKDEELVLADGDQVIIGKTIIQISII